MRGSALVAATALLLSSTHAAADPSGTVHSQYRSFFKPAPGTTAVLHKDEFFRPDLYFRAIEARGFIEVSPPSGKCLNITTDLSKPDIRVCKTQPVPFVVDQLGPDGSVKWLVSSDESAESEELTWPTPYRLGKAVIIGHNIDGNSFPLVLTGCRAEPLLNNRKISLGVLGRNDFVIRLPKADSLIQPQPEPFPNLFVQNANNQKGGIPVTGVKSLFTMKEEKERQKTRRAKDTWEDPRKLKPWPALGLIDKWEIDRRDAYEMDSSHVVTNVSQPEGTSGKCRYKFSGFAHDAGTGAIECQYTSEFQWLFLPLTCLGDLKL